MLGAREELDRQTTLFGAMMTLLLFLKAIATVTRRKLFLCAMLTAPHAELRLRGSNNPPKRATPCTCASIYVKINIRTILMITFASSQTGPANVISFNPNLLSTSTNGTRVASSLPVLLSGFFGIELAKAWLAIAMAARLSFFPLPVVRLAPAILVRR